MSCSCRRRGGIFSLASPSATSSISKGRAPLSAELCASNDASFNLEAWELPERVDGEIATANYFTTFAYNQSQGVVFTADEDKPASRTWLSSGERLWRSKLHSDPSIVGQPIRINGLPTTVLGVMPRSFDPLLSSSDLWVPAAFSAGQLADHRQPYLNVMARLKPGILAGASPI